MSHYKQLQATLKQFKLDGLTVECKLNAKEEVLQAEYDRLTAIDTAADYQARKNLPDQDTVDSREAFQWGREFTQQCDQEATANKRDNDNWLTDFEGSFCGIQTHIDVLTRQGRVQVTVSEETLTEVIISLAKVLSVLAFITYRQLLTQAVRQLTEVHHAITPQASRLYEQLRAYRRGHLLGKSLQSGTQQHSQGTAIEHGQSN